MYTFSINLKEVALSLFYRCVKLLAGQYKVLGCTVSTYNVVMNLLLLKIDYLTKFCVVKIVLEFSIVWPLWVW